MFPTPYCVPCAIISIPDTAWIPNIINPLLSLLSEDVYAIPALFIIGWRGEPGVHDEPQHVHQGKVTLSLLETMRVPYVVVDKDMTAAELETQMQPLHEAMQAGRQAAAPSSQPPAKPAGNFLSTVKQGDRVMTMTF